MRQDLVLSNLNFNGCHTICGTMDMGESPSDRSSGKTVQMSMTLVVCRETMMMMGRAPPTLSSLHMVQDPRGWQDGHGGGPLIECSAKTAVQLTMAFCGLQRNHDGDDGGGAPCLRVQEGGTLLLEKHRLSHFDGWTAIAPI
jgi:hypothetical protein